MTPTPPLSHGFAPGDYPWRLFAQHGFPHPGAFWWGIAPEPHLPDLWFTNP